MKILKFFLLSIVLVACAGAEPVKDYTVRRYLCNPGCLEWIDENDVIRETCPGDRDYPEEKELFCMTFGDYSKELNYQNRLINACKKWKK